jgi:putative restriction endonuclease
MGTDPSSADNRWLLDAMQRQIPIIYFLGTSPGRYQPIIPTFIVGWHPERLRVQLAFGALLGGPRRKPCRLRPPSGATRCVKSRRGCIRRRFSRCGARRLWGRCAISHVPEPRLLDAAHIVMDANEQLGQPIVSNGLP